MMAITMNADETMVCSERDMETPPLLLGLVYIVRINARLMKMR
jgi:hypothetical protein